MSSLGHFILHLSLFTLLYACGKDNKSGRNNEYPWNNPYSSPYGTNPLLQTINSPYSYGNMSVNQVLAENPCVSGYGGMIQPGMTVPYGGQYAGQRLPIQIPLTSFPSVISQSDIYVGVTSYGDVAVIAGQGLGAPPIFVAYMCPRSFAPSGTGQLMGVQIGSYSQCLFKPITAADVVFPGGGVAKFRWADAGSSMNQRFSFCR